MVVVTSEQRGEEEVRNEAKFGKEEREDERRAGRNRADRLPRVSSSVPRVIIGDVSSSWRWGGQVKEMGAWWARRPFERATCHRCRSGQMAGGSRFERESQLTLSCSCGVIAVGS